MPATTPHKALVDLETKFWQSMVDEDTDAALQMLTEPALMVSAHGAMKFDHEGYRKMAEQGSMVVKSFELSDMEVVFPNETTAVLTYRVKQSVAARGNGSLLRVTDTAAGTVVAAQVGAGGTWVDVVMLDNLHGQTLASMLANGMLVA